MGKNAKSVSLKVPAKVDRILESYKNTKQVLVFPEYIKSWRYYSGSKVYK